jgi:DNA-binding transcriptional LysR family regulator
MVFVREHPVITLWLLWVVAIPLGAFDRNTCSTAVERNGVLEHLGIAQAPAWLFAAELREGTVLRLLTSYERSVSISAVRPASRRASTRVRVLMEHFEASFEVCTQFNPRPAAAG